MRNNVSSESYLQDNCERSECISIFASESDGVVDGSVERSKSTTTSFPDVPQHERRYPLLASAPFKTPTLSYLYRQKKLAEIYNERPCRS